MPDSEMILRIADVFNVDFVTLFRLAAQSDESPNIIMVDDSKIILTDGLAVLDIELGTASGFELCRTLIDINPRTNIVFLTAYPDYSLEAWHTGAVGFILKPITKAALTEALGRLRYPFTMGGADG